VAINLGTKDGVREGMEFIVHDGSKFLGNAVITKADMSESAGRVSLKAGDIKTNVKFAQWAAKAYPAKHYAQFHWDHGSGIFGKGKAMPTKGFGWDDTGSQAVANRLSATVPITLNGGALVIKTRAGVNANYTLGGGTFTLGQGNSNIQVIPNATGGAGEVSLTITNGPSTWTRALGATLTFSGGTPGDNPFIRFGAAPTLSNGIIAPWLTVVGSDGVGQVSASLATYDPGYGVRMLTSYVDGSGAIFSSGGSDKNVMMRGNVTLLAGNQSVNSLTINNATLDFVSDTSTDLLTIESGALLGGNANNDEYTFSFSSPGGHLPLALSRQLRRRAQLEPLRHQRRRQQRRLPDQPLGARPAATPPAARRAWRRCNCRRSRSSPAAHPWRCSPS
jgi:hypothetical protein